MKCKNCENEVDGNFCTNCGQNTRVDKLNLPNFLVEISDSIFQLNRGLLYTIKKLFYSPGHTIREFLDGKRKEYFKPLAFVLVLSTVYYLVSQLTESNTILDDFFLGSSNAAEDKGEYKKPSALLDWTSNNYAYTTLLLIPFFSLATFIAFIGLGRNYLEHIVINSFITGQQAIIYSFFMILSVVTNYEDITVLMAVIISVLFNFWTFSQFFSNRNRFKITLRLLLAYILFIFFGTLIFFLTMKFLI